MRAHHIVGDVAKTTKASTLPMTQRIYSFFQSAIPESTTVKRKNKAQNTKIQITAKIMAKIPETRQSSLLE